MFEKLTSQFSKLISKVTGKKFLDKSNIKEAVKMVKKALVAADVNFKIVRDFIKKVEEEAVGTAVVDGVTPSQMFVKIVYDKLVELLGNYKADLNLEAKPSYIMMLGLQGSGKTTTAAKLAKFLKDEKGKRVALCSADIYRPAAIEQLKTLAEQVGVDFYGTADKDAISNTYDFKDLANSGKYDIIIVDTAGRLHLDQAMMDEVAQMSEILQPQEKLLVVDAMTGQEAAKVAKEFENKVGITGVIVTKMDGDARGGAIISVTATIEKPVKFIGIGEKIDALEEFYPDRIASRILGMGDIVSLVEKAQKVATEEYVKKMQEKIKKLDFDLNDFLEQLRQVKKMGSLSQIFQMIPGIGSQLDENTLTQAEKEFKKAEAIINSMTPQERANPYIIDASRKRRIAKGSGTTIQDVTKLLKDYEEMRKMMKGVRKMMFGKGAKKKMKKLMKGLKGKGLPNLPFPF